MNSRSPRKIRFTSMGLFNFIAADMVKALQILKNSSQSTEREVFRHRINLQHQKKAQRQIFNKWKGRV